MGDGVSVPEAASQPAAAGGTAVATRRWCSECGALPTDQVRPRVSTIFGAQVMYELPCSVQGCAGKVTMSMREFQVLHQAGVVAETPFDLMALRKVSNQALLDLETGEDVQSRMAAGKLALAVANSRLKMAGLVPQDSGPVTINAIQNNIVEPGDAVDRRLDRMFDERHRGQVFDAEPLDPVKPSTPPPRPTVPPADSTPDDDDGGWV